MSLVTKPGEVTLETSVAKRGNFLVQLTYQDFAAGVVGTPLVIPAFTSLANVQGLELDHVELAQPFQDISDSANNSTSIQIGDAGTANRHLTATELNANGAYVPLKFGTATKFVPTVDTPCTITVTAPAGKNVANLNRGKLLAYFKVTDSRVVV